jgi:hypothetical protein
MVMGSEGGEIKGVVGFVFFFKDTLAVWLPCSIV